MFIQVSGQIFRISLLIAALALFFTGCHLQMFQQSENDEPRSAIAPQLTGPAYQNSFSVPGQVLPPATIKSIELYREGRRGGLPAIRLGSGQQLVLKFDEIGMRHQTFTVRITHHNSDWSRSNLIPNFYIRGYENDQIVGHRPSNVQNPAYNNYQYKFPNENMRLLVSGNYMIQVHSFETNELLFSMPFLIHEDAGSISAEIEEFYAMEQRNPLRHQVFTKYQYPDFVNMPQVDLDVFYVQNHFLGRARFADQDDMSEVGIYRTYISRNNAFAGRYEFRNLNINRMDRPDRYIVEFRPETIPPRVVMFRDVVNLDVRPRGMSSNRFGTPRHDLDARYADVRFELQAPPNEIQDHQDVYVVGPFNNWAVTDRNQMHYDTRTGSYHGNAIVKEGIYDYKYVVVTGNVIDDLRLDASFADSRQNYTSLIYYRDQQEQIDRLLKIHEFQSR